MNVLVINCGSSSLKFQLINAESEEVLAKGICERIGIDGRLTYQPEGGEKEKSEKAMPTHTEAIQFVIEALTNPETGVVNSLDEIGAVGHRVVHGGEKFASSVVITEDVLKAIEECNDLAPLHNPANLIGINACQKLMPNTPMVAVFDTAFHQTMPATAYTYGLPYEYYENDEIVGIDVEIATAIAEELGMKLEVEDMAFDSVIPAVSSGKADIGVAGMTVDPDRLESVNFSDTYADASQVIIVKEDSAIAGPADLEGKSIGVQLGTTGDTYSSENVKDAKVEQYSKGFEAVQALTQGKIDAVVIDSHTAKEFVKEAEGLKILDEPLTEEEYAIAIAKDNKELMEKINDALAKLEESGKLNEIMLKYIPAE